MSPATGIPSDPTPAPFDPDAPAAEAGKAGPIAQGFAPADNLLPDASAQVCYRARNGRVCTAYQTGPTTWAHAVLDWNAPPASGSLTLGPSGRIYYRGYDDRLHCVRFLP